MRYVQQLREDKLLMMKIIGIERLVKKQHLGVLPAVMADGRAAAEVPNPPPASRREPRTFNHPCAICAGVATGYHYEVPSCNGCKTFFRRTVLSRKTYRCISGDGKCLNDRHNNNNNDQTFRKKIRCRNCRYERCLKQGMSPDSVTTLSSLLDTETVELRRLLMLEQECASYRPDNVSWDEVQKLQRLSGPIIERQLGPELRLPPDQEGAMSKDLLRANRFACDFEEFSGIAEDKQDEIIRLVVFPLTVAKEAMDLVDTEEEAEAFFGYHLAKLVSPFLREQVEHAEFVLIKSLLLLNFICAAGNQVAELARTRHLRLVWRYLTERVGSQAPIRLMTLISVFQHLILNAGNGLNRRWRAAGSAPNRHLTVRPHPEPSPPPNNP